MYYIKKPAVILGVLLLSGLLCLFFVRTYFRTAYNDFKWTIELLIVRSFSQPVQTPIQLPTIITHAGGYINGITYTNSLDALNFNYSRGCRYFEIDFELTSDNKIVLMHDWKQSVEYIFMNKPHCYTLSEFKNETTINNITLMSIDDLEKWLRNKSDTFIITDTKRNTLKIYHHIQKKNPDLLKHLIPQIYYMWQYPFIKAYGYKNCILTLYKAGYSDSFLKKFISATNVSTITMTLERAHSTPPMELYSNGIRVFAHTVNDKNFINKMENYGLYGVYSDSLLN